MDLMGTVLCSEENNVDEERDRSRERRDVLRVKVEYSSSSSSRQRALPVMPGMKKDPSTVLPSELLRRWCLF